MDKKRGQRDQRPTSPSTNRRRGRRNSFDTYGGSSSSQPSRRQVLLEEENPPLPVDFSPTAYSVIVGKGKRQTQHTGNRRLRVLAEALVPKYSESKSRKEKTEVITGLIETLRAACPVGAFVKFQDGRWWEVDDHVAREKVGYVFRDLLHDEYKSSSQSKTARRRKLQKEGKREEEELEHGQRARRRRSEILPPVASPGLAMMTAMLPSSSHMMHLPEISGAAAGRVKGPAGGGNPANGVNHHTGSQVVGPLVKPPAVALVKNRTMTSALAPPARQLHPPNFATGLRGKDNRKVGLSPEASNVPNHQARSYNLGSSTSPFPIMGAHEAFNDEHDDSAFLKLISELPRDNSGSSSGNSPESSGASHQKKQKPGTR